MDCAMLPHAKLAILHCMPCVITYRQQASGDIESTLLQRLTADRPTAVGFLVHVCTARLKLHLVNFLMTHYTNKFATNSQQIELIELEP